MRMNGFLCLGVFLTVWPIWASAISERSEIELPGIYTNHLQDVWFDAPNGVIYWAHTDVLLKTDMQGRILCQAMVGEHHAGIGLRNGRLFVAMCTMASLFGGKAEKDSRVTIGEFDAKDLSLVAYHKTMLNDRAGSLAVLDDGTFLVGCLRPLDVTATQVKFHHLDGKFNLIKTYVIDNVPVMMGIETLKVWDGFTYLHVYSVDAASRPLDFDTIKLDANYREVWRGRMQGDRGIFFEKGDRWSGRSDLVAGGGWRSRLVKTASAPFGGGCRPGCGAAVPAFRDAAPKRLCAHRGLPATVPENSLPGFAAVVGLGAAEIEFDLWWTKDGEIVSVHDATLERVSDGAGKVYEKTYEELKRLDFGSKYGKSFAGLRIMRFADLLAKLSCHTLMNIHLKSLPDTAWDEHCLKKVVGLVDAYGARGHVYFMTENGPLQDQLARLAPDIPRCMGHDARQPDRIVERAVEHRCQMVQLFKPHFDRSTIDRAHAAGLRCNVFWSDDPEEAKRFFEMGIDTILTDDYLHISAATGLK